MRRLVGWGAAFAALVAAALGVWSIAALWHWPSAGFFDVAFSGPRYQSGQRSENAQGLTAVDLQVSAAALTVKTLSSTRTVHVSYHLPVGTVPHITRSGSRLTIDVGGALLGFNIEGSPTITVTMPPGLAVGATVQAGPITLAGRFSSLRLVDAAGPVAAAALTTRFVTIDDAAGPITIGANRSPTELSLVDSAGPIIWTGPWPLSGTVRDEAGDVTLEGTPAGQTSVTVIVSAGQLTSGFPDLPSGGSGTYAAVVGSGPRHGTLTVMVTAGNATLMP